MGLTNVLSMMAGIHCVPASNYLSHCPPDTVRVAFDQDGTIYPRDSSAPLPCPQRKGGNFAFSIASHLQHAGFAHGDAQVAAARQAVADEIRWKLAAAGARHLSVLIHGYDNSYDAASGNYAVLRSRLAALMPEPTVYLEVFWDGLCRGPVTLPWPLLYWFDALTYSNLAGQVGLRAVLNRLPKDLALFVCTHSRGAGVALSAVADPKYDTGLGVPSFEPSRLKEFRNLSLVCLAPAVGNGHPLADVRAAMPARSSLGIGFNALDPALGKSIAKAKHFGDTSLGVIDHCFRAEQKLLNVHGEWLYRFVYRRHRSHDLAGYVQHAGGKPFDSLIHRARCTLDLSAQVSAA